MKIEMNELRLGNWMMGCHGKPIQVDVYGFNALEDNDDPTCPQPIQLTPEILEKCGFVFVENIAHWANMDDDLSYWKIVFKGGKELQVFKDYSCNLTDHDIPIQSLHQLQNLYFALTGEELVVKL